MWNFILTFAADKHNSITNKQKVAKKNERNDNDNGQMPSGSKTKMKTSLWIGGRIVSCRSLVDLMVDPAHARQIESELSSVLA